MQYSIKSYYNYNIETVWNALTDKEILSKCIVSTDFKSEIGKDFTFKSEPMPNLGWDGVVKCKILEVSKPTLLKYTWKEVYDNYYIDTIVIFELKEKNNKTELKFTHTGFSGIKGFIISQFIKQSWKKTLKKKLIKYLK